MTNPTFFTVVADFKSVVVDLEADVDPDPQLGPVTGKVTFTPVLANGDLILATNASPRPTMYVPAPIVARIDTDGRLKLRVEPDGDRDNFANLAAFPGTGNTAKVYFAIDTQTFYRWDAGSSQYIETLPYAEVRLLADTPLLELETDLYYRVAFSEVVFNGSPGYIKGFTFQAPTSDTELNLVEVARVPGQPAVGITKIAPGAVRAEDGNLIFSFGGVDLDEPVPYLDVDVTLDSTDISDGTATGRALITAANAAAARTAIGSPAKTVVDLRDYVTSSVTLASGFVGYRFNLVAVVAAMEAGGGACYIPPGLWQPTSFNVALDAAATPPMGNAGSTFPGQSFTYRFFGAGGSSHLIMPSGMIEGDYLFNVNSAATASYVANPRVYVEDFVVRGTAPTGFTTSTSGSFMKLNYRGVQAKRLLFNTVYEGFSTYGYSDNCSLYQVTAAELQGGWLFRQYDLGDAHVFEQVIASSATGANALQTIKLRGSQGATIRGSVTGMFEFLLSTVTMDGCHLESYYPEGSTRPLVDVRNSQVTIKGGTYYTNPNRAVFRINDYNLLAPNASNLVIEAAAAFYGRLDTPAVSGGLLSGYGALLGPVVDVLYMEKSGSVRSFGAKHYIYDQKTGGGGGLIAGIIGLTVTASGDGTLNTALSTPSVMACLGGDFTIKYVNGAWSVFPSAAMPIQATSTPSVTCAAITGDYADTWGTDIATGTTHYYRVAVRNVAGLSSAASSEVSATTTSGLPVIRLSFEPGFTPATVRIWRGTAADTYTRWVDIPIAASGLKLVDQGTAIAGFAWKSTSVPAHPTASELVDGIYYPYGGEKMFFTSAIPTAGTHAKGDVGFNNNPSSGDPRGWVCVTAGTPGTWEPLGATLNGTETLLNKSLTSAVLTTPRINSIRDTNGNPFITMVFGSTVTSNLAITSAATGDVSVGVNSTDTDVNLYLEPKNAGFVGIRNGVSGVTPKIQVGGPDTNLSLNLGTKGSGKVQFNGVEAVDISSSQSLTNKNLNSGTNTFPTLNQNTTGTAANITGTAAIANGGTGQTTAAAAITALTGSQTSGRYLRSDGTNAALAAIVAGDVPTLNQNTTGSAASLTTARKINGTDFNGTAAINPAPDAFLSTMGVSPAWAFIVQSTIGSNQAVLANNSGFFVPIRPRQNISVSSLAWVVGLQSGNYDIGIYDSTGARLWSRGSTAVTTAGTQVAETVTDVSMVAGTTYYIAWSSDTTSSAVKGLGGAGTAELARSMDGTLAVVSVASVFPLPSTVTIGTSTVNRFPFIALRGTSS